jgi:hypothetical protein
VIRRAVFSLLVFFAAIAAAFAQSQKLPSATPISQAAGTVTAGGTFQTVLAANANRSDCALQNNGTNIGYVYWRGTGTASLLNSYQLPAGAVWHCNVGGAVIRTAIQFTTSTTADPFVIAESQ